MSYNTSAFVDLLGILTTAPTKAVLYKFESWADTFSIRPIVCGYIRLDYNLQCVNKSERF
jgi:hypothetical protein